MCDCVHTGGCQRACHLRIQSLLSIFFEVRSLIFHCISQPGWHTNFLGFSWLHLSSCIEEQGLQRLSILRHRFYMDSVDPTGVLMTQCKSFAHQDCFPDPNSRRKWQTFPQRLLHFTSLLVNVVRLLISPPPCQTYYVTLITSYLCGCGLVSLCGFDFHFPKG